MHRDEEFLAENRRADLVAVLAFGWRLILRFGARRFATVLFKIMQRVSNRVRRVYSGLMSKLEIRIIPVTPIAQNCSLLSDTETGEAVLIDPGGDVPALLGALEELNLTLKEIWLTHGHLDHAGGADEIREKTGVSVISGDWPECRARPVSGGR